MAEDSRREVVVPVLGIAWDPRYLTEEEFAQIVTAFGNVYREAGARRLKLIERQELKVQAGVLA